MTVSSATCMLGTKNSASLRFIGLSSISMTVSGRSWIVSIRALQPRPFRLPVDAWEDEIVPDLMGLQNVADRLEIVLRADRTHNAALCERNDDIAVFPAEGDAALAEGAFPEGLVEVPDDEPHRLRRKLTHVLSSAALGTGAICYSHRKVKCRLRTP